MPEHEEVVRAYTKSINEALNAYLPPAETDAVCEAMRYSVENGGKRIRPILTLAFCELCGGDTSSALPFACAVEMIHAYSLIHDDLPCMDDDDVRRGKPSCHVRYGEAVALLAGDGLLTLAFETLLSSDLPAAYLVEAGRELSSAAGWSGMIGGQVIDLNNVQRVVTEDDLVHTDIQKTGKLITAAAVLGCIAAGADMRSKKAAAEYACSLGLAFQIMDDVLDVAGDEAVLGKPVGSDAANDKATYVTLFGLDDAKKMALDLTAEAKEKLSIFGPDASFLCSVADTLADRKK